MLLRRVQVAGGQRGLMRQQPHLLYTPIHTHAPRRENHTRARTNQQECCVAITAGESQSQTERLGVSNVNLERPKHQQDY